MFSELSPPAGRISAVIMSNPGAFLAVSAINAPLPSFS
jgi:hypothetical protein